MSGVQIGIRVTRASACRVLLVFSLAWRCAGAEVPEHEPVAREDRELADLVPAISREGGYVSSAECVECHQDEHASWHRSYHRTMTQLALPGQVAGAFDGSTIRSEGLEYRVFREGDEYWAEVPDPDVMMYIVQGGRELSFDKVPRRRQRVVLTTGSHHYQTYWVTSPRYKWLMQTLPLVYLLEDKRWVPRGEAFMKGPKDEGRFITQWNHHCIRCHSTGGNPGLNPETGMLETRVGEFGIACEACHGPGEAHVKLRRSLVESGAEEPTAGVKDPIVDPRDLDHRRSSQVCGQCHGVYVMRNEFAMESASEGSLFKPGEDLHVTRYYIEYPLAGASLERREDLKRNPEFFRERWWDDGTILAGGREYSALSVAGCYQRGKISCLSCHTMHGGDPNDQLKRFGSDNQQCTQCHGEERYTARLEEHTHHRPDSSGSNCLNCHMPHTTYALFKGIRSHQIGSPVRVGGSGASPNACNLCHLDQTLDWTQTHLAEWYGVKPVELNEDERTVAASLLWALKGHAGYRAIAAWHWGWDPAKEAAGDHWQAPFAARLLEDPYGVVRYVAARSLRTLPRFEGFEYDFLADASELAARSHAAREHWRGGRGVDRGREGLERILLDERGEVLGEQEARLLQERDNRSVTIKE